MKNLLLGFVFISFPVFSLSSEEILESFNSKNIENILGYMNSYDEIELLLLENLENKLKRFRAEDNDPLSIIALFNAYQLIVESGFSDIEKNISYDLTKKLGIKKSMFMNNNLNNMVVHGSLSPSIRTFEVTIKTKESLYVAANAFGTNLEEWFKANHSWYGKRNLSEDKELLYDLLCMSELVPKSVDWENGFKQVSKLCFIYFVAILSTEDFVSQHFRITFDGVIEFINNGKFIRGDIFYEYPDSFDKNVYSLALTNKDLKEKGGQARFSELREYLGMELVKIFKRDNQYVKTFKQVMGIFPRLTKNADSGRKNF